uniref:Uncharacterized protein n=1 Tax=Romanomermis culicivorax TaxID=13658 RepID=A0A915LAH9_ROMCU
MGKSGEHERSTWRRGRFGVDEIFVRRRRQRRIDQLRFVRTLRPAFKRMDQ